MNYRKPYFYHFFVFGYLSSLLVFLAIASLFDLSLLNNYFFANFSYPSTQEVSRILLEIVRYLLSSLFIIQWTNAISVLLIPATLFNFGQIEFSEIGDIMLSTFAFSLTFAIPLNLVASIFSLAN